VDGDDGSDDSDCSHRGDPCRSIQFAVDAARPGDDILVSAGVYTGVHMRVRDDFTSTGTVMQVVYISKSVTVRGGYNDRFSDPPDPESNPTTVDALGQGRVLYVVGDAQPTVEGLRITGGDATGLQGDPWYDDGGGGIYIHRANGTIRNCVVFSNTASRIGQGAGGGFALYESTSTVSGNIVEHNIGSVDGRAYGGGLHLWKSPATLAGNTVQSNTAGAAGGSGGGGVSLWFHSEATLEGNTVQGNTASAADEGSAYGGGMYIDYSAATVIDNVVRNNRAGATVGSGTGGGLYLTDCPALLIRNVVRGNIANTMGPGFGGGLSCYSCPATLNGNTIVSNTASLNPASFAEGGGLSLRGGNPITLTNNLVVDNHAAVGGGVLLDGIPGQPALGYALHNTIADNQGGGQGVFLHGDATLVLGNTIIAGHHGAGISVNASCTATLEATLWHDNGMGTEGEGTILTGTINVTGNPSFVDPDTWDYHLTSGSPAIDAGVDAGVATDIDGDSRVEYAPPDIGADEFTTYRVLLPLVQRSE
jgi:hypothetical protein